MSDKQPTLSPAARVAKALELLSEYQAWRRETGLEPNGRAYRLLVRCENLAEQWGIVHR